MVCIRISKSLLGWAVSTTALALGIGPLAAEAVAASPSFVLSIRNQAFEPRTLTLPAGQQVEIQLKNEDAVPAEFESSDLNREKVVPGGTTLPLYVGPLSPGRYQFFNDFQPSSTGTIVVVPSKR